MSKEEVTKKKENLVERQVKIETRGSSLLRNKARERDTGPPLLPRGFEANN